MYPNGCLRRYNSHINKQTTVIVHALSLSPSPAISDPFTSHPRPSRLSSAVDLCACSFPASGPREATQHRQRVAPLHSYGDGAQQMTLNGALAPRPHAPSFTLFADGLHQTNASLARPPHASTETFINSAPMRVATRAYFSFLRSC